METYSKANKLAIWAALEAAGKNGITAAQLQEKTGAPIQEVRVLIKNRLSKKSGTVTTLLPPGNHPQVYALRSSVDGDEKPRFVARKEKPKPVKKPAPQRETPICSGTAPRITTGNTGLIPRMTCARPGADAHLAVPSRRGPELVAHRTPIHMCSALGGGAK